MTIRSYQGIAPTLGQRVFVDDTALVLGDVHIGDDSSVWPMTTVRGDMHRIRIGRRTSIQDNSVLHITHAGPFSPEGWPLIIGDDCTVGHRAILHGCTIGNRVLIGMGAVVMDGAIIEDDVVVGANSLVSPGKHLASGFLYMGSPARAVRELSERERRFFAYSSNNYVALKEIHRAEQGAHP
ncbi:MAG TPA: gamma carbonic anhydrase family protein [Pseudomonadales bacterium]|jgi:carbonic anhydrase/acetyltransferase-like protein (isoleucine patch superfamily)